MKLIDFRFDYGKGVALDLKTGKSKVDPETGESIEIYHPLVPCIFCSRKKRSPSMEGLLDSGSDGVVIPMRLATHLGLEMRTADEPMMVADGKSVDRFVSETSLIIGRGGRHTDPIEVKVSIPAEGNPPILIGRDPIFKLFVITFIEAEKRLEMKPFQVH